MLKATPQHPLHLCSPVQNLSTRQTAGKGKLYPERAEKATKATKNTHITLLQNFIFIIKLFILGVLKAFEGERFLIHLGNRVEELSPHVDTFTSSETPTGTVQ